MSTTMVDVLLHIDETTTADEREDIRDALLSKKGVMSADCRDDRPHLMIVGYDPDNIKNSDLIAIVQNRGYHAELVGM